MADRRRFTTRPRTRVYDCNYNIGENYYRSALDNLDRKYGRLPTETIDAPKRPISIGDLDSFLGPQREQTADRAALAAAVAENEEDHIRETVQRIQRARAAFAPTPEENFERSFMNRREEVKKRFNEKMLDTVGLNGILKEDEPSTTLRRRAVKILTDTEDETPKLTRWTALREPATLSETADELAARARARASRARLADLENEMEELAEKGAARERRLAGLRQLLNDSEETDNTVRMRKKVVTTTVEKRVL